jgi:hypothetical protein
MRHIKRESLSNKIYLPDLATQQSIVAFLEISAPDSFAQPPGTTTH